jgi:hypothetical protein
VSVWQRLPDLRHVRNDRRRRRGLNRNRSRSLNTNAHRRRNKSRRSLINLKADPRLHLEAERAKARNHKT